ncbi:MAG: hypothetical protein AB7G93_19610 [Bdellovibrionales bacterium]
MLHAQTSSTQSGPLSELSQTPQPHSTLQPAPALSPSPASAPAPSPSTGDTSVLAEAKQIRDSLVAGTCAGPNTALNAYYTSALAHVTQPYTRQVITASPLPIQGRCNPDSSATLTRDGLTCSGDGTIQTNLTFASNVLTGPAQPKVLRAYDYSGATGPIVAFFGGEPPVLKRSKIRSADDFVAATDPYTEYILENDIDLSNVTLPVRIQPFMGVLDGNGHTITNMTVTKGLFRHFGGYMKNITFNNPQGEDVILAETCTQGAVFSKVKMNGPKIVGGGGFIGGVAGKVGIGCLIDVNIDGTFQGESYTASVAGVTRGIAVRSIFKRQQTSPDDSYSVYMKKVTATGDVRANTSSGGFVGDMGLTLVDDSSVTGSFAPHLASSIHLRCLSAPPMYSIHTTRLLEVLGLQIRRHP